jgi:hypothetical protein
MYDSYDIDPKHVFTKQVFLLVFLGRIREE